ncbi:MAG: 5'-methylthioadenosine/S-adenosylhomocysteine nucleosidase [Oscillospiraceae bacterium]
MKNELKIAVIIADDAEYEPIKNIIAQKRGREQNMFERMGHCYEFEKNGKKIVVNTVLCGIGMVNAAAAAMYYAANGADILVSIGMSGGISPELNKGDIILGTGFVEHDFDLTGIGYKPAEKPLQTYIYSADKILSENFISQNPHTKTGVMVSGDRFVCTAQDRDSMISMWNAVSCDMETAASAYVAYLSGKRYLAIRKISDGAGDNAVEEYTAMNTKSANQWIERVFEFFEHLILIPELW